MYQEGRNEGGYRCSGAKRRNCWMKATALREDVHRNISKAICDHLLLLDGYLDTLVDSAAQCWHDDTPAVTELNSLRDQERELKRQCARGAAVTLSGTDPPESLVKLLEEREKELHRVQAHIDEIELKTKQDPPTKEAFEQSLHEAAAGLLSMNRDAGVILDKLLSGPIRAVPYQQFGSNKVVLRAEFQINIANILSGDLQACLDNATLVPPVAAINAVEFSVNLFEPTDVPKNAVRAWELANEKKPNGKALSLLDIAEKLGISKRGAHLAKHMGKAMLEAGVTDPFIRLTEPPKNASRWRSRRRAQIDEADDQACA